MQIPFIKYSKVWLAIGAISTAVSIVLILMWGLKPGIDFTGGSLVELSFSKQRPASEEMEQALGKIGIKQAVIQKSEDNRMIIRTGFLSEDEHQVLIKGVEKSFQTEDNKVIEDRFETIGGAVSKQLRDRSLWAALFVSGSIIIYLAFAFRSVSHPIASWKYGLVAIATLFYVVVVVVGIFAALGRFKGVEVDIAFVVAILTVLGYSVNDSIVVYDRIRERLLKHNVDDFPALVNTGLNETLARSINTVFAVLLPLFALYFFGGPTVHYFVLALILGMALSTVASIFIASPLLVQIYRWQERHRA
ncbi:MAG: Protein-export membrane protein SecF [Parcubacteria group bacterium Gr01-1014_13]|nr:MAG: Protein-export membrane protein SecF [Parcubacteria group bacterium Gr01-1014_13]